MSRTVNMKLMTVEDFGVKVEILTITREDEKDGLMTEVLYRVPEYGWDFESTCDFPHNQPNLKTGAKVYTQEEIYEIAINYIINNNYILMHIPFEKIYCIT